MASIDLPPMTEPYFRVFLRKRFTMSAQAPPKDLDCTGQIGIITGGNSGIGLEAAKIFLEHHLSRLILTVRSQEKGDEAAAMLRQLHPSAQIDVWLLDMNSYESIQAFAARCAAELDSISFVILNAGLKATAFKTNPITGHEETIQVNYLSTILLTILLLPVLKDKRLPGHPPRLSIVTSALAYVAAFPNRDADPLLPSFDDGSKWDYATVNDRYGTSKLLGLMALIKLKGYVRPEDVVVNFVDPCFIRGTGLSRDTPMMFKPVVTLMGYVIGRPVKEGAWTYVDAVAVKGKESHGSFLWNWEIAPYVFLSSLFSSSSLLG